MVKQEDDEMGPDAIIQGVVEQGFRVILRLVVAAVVSGAIVAGLIAFAAGRATAPESVADAYIRERRITALRKLSPDERMYLGIRLTKYERDLLGPK